MARWLRPTVDTKFHIDLEWWQKQNRDIRVYLTQSLCDECRPVYAQVRDLREVDWVDPETGEVRREDALWSTLRSCCSGKPGYIRPNTPIIDSIFLTFVANGNEPLSPKELHERLDRRSAETILRMLTAGQVYLGIRPVN
ncbi:MAG: hypothetical protein QME94_04340 [Anaerolineae bacterium]|nr:hypothetical protein [Anaerolineae bacterium]